MRSRAVVVARAGPRGATELVTLAAHGAFALRRTGPHVVHVVGTAAGPVGDDEIDLRVVVGPGAHVDVRAVAATIALPGREPGTAQICLDVEVAAGGRACVALPPLVVTARAAVAATTTAAVAAGGRLDLVERVQLGRHGEDGGQWTGRVVADHDGRPALRQTQRSEALLHAISALPVIPSRRCGVVTRLVLGAGGPGLPIGAATAGGAFVVPLAAAGCLWTSVGVDLPAAERDLSALPPTRLEWLLNKDNSLR